MATRFVILHHQTACGEHWDLMLEHGDGLLTWQLACEPADRSSLPIPARRLDDHRKAYLTYEGPLRGDRGVVKRVAEGIVEFKHITSGRYVFVLRSPSLSGRLTLTECGDEWVLNTAGEP